MIFCKMTIPIRQWVMFIIWSAQKTLSSDNGNANVDTIATEKKKAESHDLPWSKLKNVQLTNEYNNPLNPMSSIMHNDNRSSNP